MQARKMMVEFYDFKWYVLSLMSEIRLSSFIVIVTPKKSLRTTTRCPLHELRIICRLYFLRSAAHHRED